MTNKPNNWEEIKLFAEDVLKKKGLKDWKIKIGSSGYTWKDSKEIELPQNATKGLVLHEIAHALDENPPEGDKHWGYHADLMHQLFDEVFHQTLQSEKEQWELWIEIKSKGNEAVFQNGRREYMNDLLTN